MGVVGLTTADGPGRAAASAASAVAHWSREKEKNREHLSWATALRANAPLGDIVALIEHGRDYALRAAASGDAAAAQAARDLLPDEELILRKFALVYGPIVGFAARYSSPDVVRYLLSLGWLAHGIENSNHFPSALTFAVVGQREDNVRLLLDAGADAAGDTVALCTAAMQDNGAILGLLLDRGAQAGARCYPGSEDTALRCAAVAGQTKNMHAATVGDVSEVRAMLDFRVDAGAKDKSTQETALSHAAKHGRHEVVRMLATCPGASAWLDSENFQGESALCLAITRFVWQRQRQRQRQRNGMQERGSDSKCDYYKTISVLLECGAKLNEFDKERYESELRNLNS